MHTEPLTRSNLCPRCRFGFIVFRGSMDGEASCLNCGHHVESNLESLEPGLFTIQKTIQKRLNSLLPESITPEPGTPTLRARRQVNRVGLDP